jgi:FkbM family methyltransferase
VALNFNKINIYFKQLGYLRAVPLIILETTRMIFDRYGRTSYAQTGEDMILNWLFPSNKGFYVEVGCNHPKAYSNTFNLYKRGWNGLCIDANKNLILEYKRFRRNDISVCAAISNHKRKAIFTEFFDSFISSLELEHVVKWEKKKPIKQRRTLITRTLNDVLYEFNAPKCFDLLSIDVEGHDYEVLLSINLNRYTPKFILIEMHKFDISNPSSNKIYNYLISMNYVMIGYLVMNGYFAKKI